MTVSPRYAGPVGLANAVSAFSLITLEDRPFRRESPEATTESRDLGIAAATAGRILMKHTRAVAPFDKETGWHWHDMDAHIVYVIRGWVRFAYAGMAEPVTVGAGACISQPTGVPHNVVGRSDDLEAIEINIPAEHGTFDPPG
ncbi:MAG: cupin domain-containing protein [Alphaproteobacteria bacterium]|nr:cupin domain-containing protein [Alphaproteobacteria bacterium]